VRRRQCEQVNVLKELSTMMGWYHDGVGWAGWLVMVAGMVAFWGLVVWAVIAIFRSTQTSPPADTAHREPLDILDERFARGEIDESEYQARADVLRTHVH
jgi:putative membrane protein